jgi:DNA-binding XRE family transcriptional regulator
MKKIKMKEAIKLVLKEGTTFDLYFLDGVVKRYNILSLAKKFPALNALKDRKLFEQGKLLGWGGVVWNDELDVSSETVYENGKDVTKEYDDIDSVVLGYKIKVKRTIRLMTQEELAKKIGIDQSDLSKIEKGTANPSLKTLSRIAKGLDGKLTFDI